MVGRFLSGHHSMRILRFPLPRRDLLKTLPLAALCCAPASMAATLTVLNADSEGPGSLYQTVADASPGDTIVFAPSLSGATIRPTLLLDYIRINQDLVIDGSSLPSKITITGDRDGDGTPDTGVVRVAAGITVTLKNLILTRSLSAAILSQGNLTIIDCEVRDSTAGFSSRGGGILAFGPTTVTGSVIANNTAGLDGGGIAINSGAFTISNSTITGNAAANSGGGIWVSLTNTGVTISNSQISGNTAVLRGGGIFNEAGAVTLTETRVTGNTSTTDHGGGLDGSFNISDSVISNNTAALNGGAIYVDSNRTATVQRSTLAGNQAGPNSYGGAILVRASGTATLINSTLSGNSGGYGGAIYNQANGTVNLASVTLAGNQSPNAGGIGGLANVGVVNFVNTLIAGSTNGDCAPLGPGSFPIRSGNLVQNGGCFSAAFPSVMLGPLADNGGLTQTHALLPGSPAIDYGDNSYCDDNPGANNLDQRGVTRPIDGDSVPGAVCDTGAYELVAQPDPVYANGFE